MTERIASCSCGRLQARVSGEPSRVSVCHCHACQRRTGSVFGAQARIARADVRITGTGTEYVRIGDAGGRCTFTFCPACGSTVYYAVADDEDRIAIPVGAFADASFPAPTVSVYEERMHAWVALPAGMTHLA